MSLHSELTVWHPGGNDVGQDEFTRGQKGVGNFYISKFFNKVMHKYSFRAKCSVKKNKKLTKKSKIIKSKAVNVTYVVGVDRNLVGLDSVLSAETTVWSRDCVREWEFLDVFDYQPVDPWRPALDWKWMQPPERGDRKELFYWRESSGSSSSARASRDPWLWSWVRLPAPRLLCLRLRQRLPAPASGICSACAGSAVASCSPEPASLALRARGASLCLQPSQCLPPSPSGQNPLTAHEVVARFRRPGPFRVWLGSASTWNASLSVVVLSALELGLLWPLSLSCQWRWAALWFPERVYL